MKTKLQKRLIALREETGDTLEAASLGIGCSRNHLWALESGLQTNPRLQLLKSLSIYFRTSVAYLIGESDKR